MPRKNINIGVEGNDATGDSIRDAFSKTNENFSELYAVFGQGGTIRFTALSDTPDELGSNKIPVSSDTGAELLMKNIVGGTGILIDNTDPSQLVITNSGGAISSDLQPTIGGYLNGSGNFTLGNIGPISDQAATDFNTTHSTQIQVHDLVADKKYNDMAYQRKGLPNRMRSEPADGSEYTKAIGSFINNNLIIASHGYDHNINGVGFKYSVSGGSAAANLVDNTIYYARFVNANQISLHPTSADAIAGTNKISANQGAAGNPGGTHTLVDSEYDSALYGTYLTTEAMPRSATVRRQGDDMTGALYLHDHPGNLAGSGTPNDIDDLQAASKFYVDNSSFTSIVDLYVRTDGDDEQRFSPVGKEGRSLQFAYKSVAKACEKAEEIIETSPLEPGAYVQTVTHTNGSVDSIIQGQQITSVHADGVPAANLIRANKEFIKKEIVEYINATYPDFQYTEATCARDMGYIVEGLAIDIENGLNANFHAIQAGKRYFSSVSGQIARTTQLTETLAGINYGKAIINIILQNGTVAPVRNTDGLTQTIDTNQTVSSTVRNAVLAKIDITTNIITNGLSVLDTTALVEGSTVTLTVTNGGQGYVDQGAPNNVDILPGKILRGKTSGALGRIVKYARGANTDELRVALIEPATFRTDEKYEYGNFTRTAQICIHVESGIFYEDFPIKLPANCSIKGTDFRRCQIRPARRGSQSKWINTYFYRDANFDGLDLLPSGNPGAVALINDNKEFVKDETIAWIEAQIAGGQGIWAGFTYNAAKCERDTGIILDGIAHDIKYNGNAKTYENASKYYSGTTSLINGQEAQTAAALNKTKEIVTQYILPQVAYTPLQSVTSQITDSANQASSANITRVETLMDSIVDVVTNGLANLPDLVDPRYGYHYTVDPTKAMNVGTDGQNNPGNFPFAAEIISYNKDFIVEETIAYINATYPSLAFNESKCRRDTGLIIDGIMSDLKVGGRVSSLANQTAYYAGAVTGQETETADAINYIKTIGAAVLAKTAFADSRQSTVAQNITTDAVAEANALTNHNALIDCVKFAFDANYNPPKNNDQIDVFMMNDANRIMNVTMQGHGGFAQVLDPDGQILIKSPYVQVCGSFSRSQNKQVFAGGMYIDNFTSNLTMTVISKDDPFTLNVSSGVGSGLRQRRPETPAPFYIQGIRYQVDAVTNYDQAAGTATLFLNPTSGDGNGFTLADFTDIVLQSAGNTSMLANDYTQVNDLGYGIVVNNGALTEQVSTFTYYCHAAYMANNGSQIRSLNGSNSNGNFGLVAAGSDPNEVIDQITLRDPMVQTARVYDDGNDFINVAGKNIVYVYETADIPTNISELEIDHGGSIGITRYEVSSVQATTETVTSPTPIRSGIVYKLNISGNDGLAASLSNDQKVVIRNLQNFIFDNLENVATIRPSTAIVFDEQDDFTYRTIALGGADSLGNALGSGSVLATFDSNYDYIRMTVDQSNVTGTAFAGAGTTHGATAGDRVIAIETITEQKEINRLNNGDMIFAWEGKLHRVDSYSQKSGFAIIAISDVNSINDPNRGDSGVPAQGLAVDVQNSDAIVLRAGLNANENAGLTVNISVARATGHDFNDIGSGGFNTSNYPSKIFGAPQEPQQANEVQERDKGRVFYVSTDQDGFFRVGRFFTVDQGTGRVTFAASIALSNLDGIGFKRGVVITEFSSDDGMTDNAVDSAPTESAVRGYVNRRLGIDENSQATSNLIGSGFLALDGSTTPSANISFGNNNITALGDPGADFDATNKRYVDGRTPFGNSLMYGTGTNGARDANDIIIWTGSEWDTATPTGYVEFTYDAGTKTVSTGIADGSITNADVNAGAQIAQSKLNMQAATTGATSAGITQSDLGLAKFDNNVFSSTGGFISIDNGQLPVEKIANISDEHVLGRATGDSSDGDISAIPFSTIVNSGGTFTTIGAPNAIVKTHTDGSINVQALDVDSARIIDTSGTTVNFTNPGTTLFLSSQTTGAGVTNNSMTGNLNVGASRATQSNFQENSTYDGENYVAADWMYSNFIEAPSEADANGTGIGIGAGTGFSQADQISFVTDGASRLIVTNDAILPATTDVYDLGSTTNRFDVVYAITTSAQANTALYADLAENYLADREYAVGTVLVFGGEQEITTTKTKGDRRVAGVVSENPGYLMNSGAEGNNVTAIALQGRVPVNVLGEVNKGDLLVTSSVEGYAMVDNDPKVGTVIGKALQNKGDPGYGTVEAVVGRV